MRIFDPWNFSLRVWLCEKCLPAIVVAMLASCMSDQHSVSGPQMLSDGEKMVIMENGGNGKYRRFVIESRDSMWYSLYAYDKDDNQAVKVYTDEAFEEGWPGMAGFVSPDKRFVYTITDHMPSVSGFPWRLSVYRTDVKTLKTTLIDSGPAIRVEEDGFTIASDAECINPDTCSAGMVYSYRDISYNFEGKQVGKSKRYMDKELENRYGENLININGVGVLNEE